MTIKEVEQRTGLTRSNIRFYEKENLIHPNRNTSNGYREYLEADIQAIKKIAYLRTLGISIEDIRRLSCKEVSLCDVIKMQTQHLNQQLSELEHARVMCEKILSSAEQIEYESLDVDKYVADVKDYWNKNNIIFKFDSIGFFSIWGGNIIWGLLAVICLLVAVFSLGYLPAEIPIQWSGDTVSSFVDKKFIFAFPFACVIIKFILRPYIWRWLKLRVIDSNAITDCITNLLCFIALSFQIFIILFVKGIMKHVTIILLIDIVVLIGLPIIMHKRNKQDTGRDFFLK